MITYIKASVRREQILKTACRLAEETHYSKIRRKHLVEHCCVDASNITRVMGSMEELRVELILYAIRNERHMIIAQAIIDKHSAVDHLSKKQRKEILMSMV